MKKRTKPNKGDVLFLFYANSFSMRANRGLCRVIVVDVGSEMFSVTYLDDEMAGLRPPVCFLNETWAALERKTASELIRKINPEYLLYASSDEYENERDENKIVRSMNALFSDYSHGAIPIEKLRLVNQIIFPQGRGHENPHA